MTELNEIVKRLDRIEQKLGIEQAKDIYSFQELPDGKLWTTEYLREPVEGAVWNKDYNCYMYTWEEAKQAVPGGMRLPTAREFMELCLELGYLEDKNKDVVRRLVVECGFAMAGCAEYSGSLLHQGSILSVWSSTSFPATNTNLSYRCFVNSLEVSPVLCVDRWLRCSVRCIRDW